MMRFHLLGLILLSSAAAVPAVAQRDTVDRRVDRLEQEMRAVQRRVFPNGNVPILEPEIRPETAGPAANAATGNALSSLTARLDALESQLRTMTGQAEENEFRVRQLESEMERLRTGLAGRLDALERRVQQAETAPEPEAAPAEESAPAPRQDPPPRAETAPATPTPAEADPVEEAYNAGFRMWEAGRFQEAQQALERIAEDHPDSRWASWARNLAGRAYLDDDKPATAARILLANYQENPRGERAADSLFFLGQALVRLNRRQEACRVYDELEEVYPAMRDFIRTRLPAARVDARCGE